MNTSRILATIILLALPVGLTLLPGCATTRQATPLGEPGRLLSFSLPDEKGRPVTMESLRGRVVVIGFWATWCSPCKEELPVLNDLLTRYGEQGLSILVVNVDGPDKQAEAKAYLRAMGFSLSGLFDPDNTVTTVLNPGADMPFTILVDRQGRQRYTHVGYAFGDEQELTTHLTTLLGQ